MLKKELINEMNLANMPLAKRIRDENSVKKSSEIAYSFIITGLQILFPGISYHTMKYSIIDNDRDGSCDAIVLVKNERTISIFDIKYSEDYNYKEIESFAGDIGKYIFNPRQTLVGLDTAAEKRINEVRKYVKAGWGVKLCIIRNGNMNPRVPVRNIIVRLQNSYPRIETYEFINIDSLVDKYLINNSGQSNYIWPIRVVSGGSALIDQEDKIVIRNRNNIDTLFARLRVSDVIKLQQQFVNNKLDLFDANVRDFQKKKNISTKILYSIRYNPSSFHIFHNGITFSCKCINKLDALNFTIKNPQIINGCQTVNTIYEAYKGRITDINVRQATVLCRFYSLQDDLIEKVCEATNTQVKISLWDLRSNDGIQKIFEKALKLKGITYKRKIASSNKDEVSITDIAQWIYACKYKKPAEAKNRKNMLFDVVLESPPYKDIFNNNMKLEDLTSICEIATFVTIQIKKIRKSRRSFEKDADLHIIAALYMLKNRKGSLLAKYYRTHRIIEYAIRVLRRRYGPDLTYNKIFTKKEETWELIETELNKIR